MNFRTDTPIEGIHEELFDLFIIKSTYTYTFLPAFAVEGLLDWTKALPWFVAMKELYGQENHPEQYERWISSPTMWRLRTGNDQLTEVHKEESAIYPMCKVTITVEAEG